MPSMLTVMLSWLTFWVDMDTGNQVHILPQSGAFLSASCRLPSPPVAHVASQTE